MGPLAGVMVCDYYIIKKRKLNLHEMYTDHGIYWYTGGYNLRAFVAFFAAVAPLMPGFAKSIANGLNVGGAWKIYTFAWIFGFVISSTTYYAINYFYPQTVSLVEEAVYPLQLGETMSPPIVDGDSVSDDLKDPTITREREIV